MAQDLPRPRPPRHGAAVTRATWTNGKRSVTGCWEWVWSAQRFVIVLDSRDRMTGEQRRIVTSNDTPEWGNWKRQPTTPEST